MTDLELTRLCAEAMGHPHLHVEENFMESRGQLFYMYHPIDADRPQFSLYDPLHDDAQAMALVKRFPIQIEGYPDDRHVCLFDSGSVFTTMNVKDLNRAVVECVARMWKAKEGK